MKILLILGILIICLLTAVIEEVTSENVGAKLDLPSNHLPYLFSNYPELAGECSQDPKCPYKMHVKKKVCWGYEENCKAENSYSNPLCDGDHKGWVKTKKEQVDTFFKQGDFGYIRDFRNSITPICVPKYPDDSSMECSEGMTFCRGRNIVIDFRDLANRSTPVLYDTDVLKEGEVGAHCKLNKRELERSLGQMSSLQSWTPELKNLVKLKKKPFDKNSGLCDMYVQKPSIFMKIDATVNMYHHFCDFFNLYASLHVNSTTGNSDMFSKDNQIIIWRTYQYSSSFAPAYRAFTSSPIMDLNHFKGKRVCFQNVIFPLLPRMIYGLFYNTPLIWGCRSSGLFHAFSTFLLHRLRVEMKEKVNVKKIRITLLSRETKYRKILNEDALINKLKEFPEYDVKRVAFNWKTDFVEQLQEMQNTDILIGMHGAGLTHLLFLPDWAVVFELFNCDDALCYQDLARLRGLKYLTWRNRDLLSTEDVDPGNPGKKEELSHAKHTNYRFDPTEFLSIVNEGVEHIKLIAKTNFQHDEL